MTEPTFPGGGRLRESETERRTLAAAVDQVHRRGLGTSLDQLVFDEVIRQAGVSRTSAYRRWPRREQFIEDVLVQLARGTDLVGGDATAWSQVVAQLRPRAADLLDAPNRSEVFIDLVRTAVRRDVEHLTRSPQWQTYLTLSATVPTLGDERLRARVAEQLAACDERFRVARARTYAQMTALFGYRLVPPWSGPDGFAAMAVAAGLSMSGLLIASRAQPDLVTATRLLRAFGSARPMEWTLGSFAVAGAVLAFVEPDPGVDWTPARVSDVLTALDELADDGAR